MFRLKVDETRKKGEPNIEGIFEIDVNGLLHVPAVDMDTGEAGDIVIENREFTTLKKGKPAEASIAPAESQSNINQQEDSQNGKETSETRRHEGEESH